MSLILSPRPITDGAIQTMINQVKSEGPLIKATLTTADGGTIRITLAKAFHQLSLAGYAGWRKRAGIDAGVEIVWDLSDD